MRESVVEEIVQEIVARLQGLNMSEQEMVLTALHGLRAHRQDIETEFSSKPNEDDDESTTQEVAKLVGGAGGAVAGASLGGRAAGLAGVIGGGILGGTVGSTATGNRDLRRGALAAGGVVCVDRGIRGAGGYGVVGKSADALGVGSWMPCGERRRRRHGRSEFQGGHRLSESGDSLQPQLIRAFERHEIERYEKFGRDSQIFP